MEPSPRPSSSRKAKKRAVEDIYTEGDSGRNRIYKFKVLIPNGTSVLLTLRDPMPRMPFEEFISKVKDEYFKAWALSKSMKLKRVICWRGEKVYIEDAYDNKIRNTVDFDKFKPYKLHILRLNDGSDDIADTYENMWDLTPDVDILRELPEEYTFEAALADLIDNSLQAIWTNGKNQRRLISVDIAEDRISIFDTGPGMDGSDENSIVKWGKMGASIHRTFKGKAIGGKPPYLTPFFGMFGYGGAIASMHLGRCALVSSKTKESKKVYTLHLEREALLGCSDSELTWKTNGGIRAPSDDEIEKSPHGSFTKVEILEPKIKNWDIHSLQCKLKDIYFPYIQCDEVSNSGKTSRPIEFQVNNTDLAEIEGGEVAITNLHSSNGPDFPVVVRFYRGSSPSKSPGSKAPQEANARLKFVYFPIVEGIESIQRITEKLKSEGYGVTENYETFGRVSIRRLGRLLPDARWEVLPFMDLRQKKGDKAQLLKKCCLRVKCFIETDAGFNPTPSKTNLANHNQFTIALKNFGVKALKEDKDMNVEIYKAGKLLSPLQLEKEYQDWLMQMHDRYDEEIDHGEDQPTLIVNPTNKKALGISSNVVRVHRVLKRKEATWKCGQKIKVLKGACPGVHKYTLYATIEYFLIEGLQGDAGGDARIICRPLGVPDENGCTLAVDDEIASLDICSSKSLPISIIDSGKCVCVDNIEWDRQLEKQYLKAPSMIELLDDEQCELLEVDGALLTEASAGQVPPKEIVAVVRPASFTSPGLSKNLDQKYIIKDSLEMSMEIKFRCEAENLQDVQHIYSACVTPSSYKGFQGLYIFPLRCKFNDLFQKAGVYLFSFNLVDSSCKNCEKRVLVKASPQVGKWELLTNKQSLEYCISAGSFFPPLSIACYDIYGNRIPFTSMPEVTVKLNTSKGMFVYLDNFKAGLSADKMTLKIEDVLIESNGLDTIRPSYNAALVICPLDDLLPVSIPCQVIPGSLKYVTAQPPMSESVLLPGSVVKQLMLEMFDAYDNHVMRGLEVQLDVNGFRIQDHMGSKRKVDDNGCINLGGLLRVTAGFGKSVSLSVLSDNEVFFKREYQIEKRELRVASKVPECCNAGSQLENLVFEVVDPKGDVDITIHDDEKGGQSHTLAIKLESTSTEDSIRYAFRQGRCTVPVISLPQNVGRFCFVAAHSRYTDLQLRIKVSLIQAPKLEKEIQSPCPSGKILLHESPSSFIHVGNQMVPYIQAPKVECDESQTPSSGGKPFLHEDPPSQKLAMVPIVNNEKDLVDKVFKYAALIGNQETSLNRLKDRKAEIEQDISVLQASIEPVSVEPLTLSDLYSLTTKEEMIRRIESRNQTAAAIHCGITRKSQSQNSWMNFTEDVVDLVALIGTVSTNKLSRILAEYLGEDQMLALVCRSFEAAHALEKYRENGEVDYTLALHAKAAALGKSIVGRFLVICLEDIRPYKGEFKGNDHQRRLALPDPVLPTGDVPAGFMGYAVNMVDLDEHQKQTKTVAGDGLRETLLYRLFGELQVYKTREDMMEARACIKHGAVSLDGGILKENGIISLGHWDPEIYFPVVGPGVNMLLASPENKEKWKQIEENKLDLDRITPLIEEESKALETTKKKFNKKFAKYNKVLEQFEKEPELRDYYRSQLKNGSQFSPK